MRPDLTLSRSARAAVAVTAALGSVVLATPASAAPATIADVVNDVGDRRADIAELAVDQDGSALVVGVRLVEYTEPRTDPHWADPRASSNLQVAIDADADGRIDYQIDFLRVARGANGLGVLVSSFPSAAFRCNGGFALDPKGGWIRLSAPKSCVPSAKGYRVQAMYGFHRSADGPLLSALVDFVPDGGRFHPLTASVGAPTGSAQPYATATPPTTAAPRRPTTARHP